MDLTDRETLGTLRTKANELADAPGVNRNWRRAYEALAHTVNTLDAMVARSTNTTGESLAELMDGLSEAVDLITWMTGSGDFSPGGTAEESWKKAQPQWERIQAIQKKYPRIHLESPKEDDERWIVCIDFLDGKHKQYHCLQQPHNDGETLWVVQKPGAPIRFPLKHIRSYLSDRAPEKD